MKHEKSCGAVVFSGSGESTQILLLRHRFGGHWSFPKGHVELGENEHQTAAREIMEETGIAVDFLDGFRHAVEYSPKQGVKKQVVYFLGRARNLDYRRQEEEISEIRWAALDTAFKIVSFENDRRLISKARVCLEQ